MLLCSSFLDNDSETDTTLAITLLTLVLCTRRAGEEASRYAGFAGWFWVPFTLILFAMQVSLVIT